MLGCLMCIYWLINKTDDIQVIKQKRMQRVVLNLRFVNASLALLIINPLSLVHLLVDYFSEFSWWHSRCVEESNFLKLSYFFLSYKMMMLQHHIILYHLLHFQHDQHHSANMKISFLYFKQKLKISSVSIEHLYQYKYYQM